MTGQSKQEIRRERRKREAEIPSEYFPDASRKITERVLALPEWDRAGTVMAYAAMEGEPDTRELITAAVQAGKRVLLPRCADGKRLEAVPFAGWERTERNAYGIPEPKGEATEEKPDVILIPCVAATAKGTRLGHGAGYYDRFLQNQKGYRVCLCFEEFLMEELPQEEWDIPMEAVITEKESYRSDGRNGRKTDEGIPVLRLGRG